MRFYTAFYTLLALLFLTGIAAAQQPVNTSTFSGLPPAGTITGNELVPLDQNGVTKRATTSQLTLGSMVLGVPSGGTGLSSVGSSGTCLKSNGLSLQYGSCGGGTGGDPGGLNGQIQYNNGGAFGGWDVGPGLAVVGNALTSTSSSGASPSGMTGNIQYNAGGGLFGGLPNSNSAYKFLSNDGSSSLNWANPANLIDPRTYGAVCPGSGITGGLTSATQGIIIANPGGSLTNGTYTSVPMTGGSGSGAIANSITIAGNVVTAISLTTTGGSGYVQRDQLSVSLSDIGGGLTAPTFQVAHLSSNGTPIYDGVHDSTLAFEAAFAAAQNTGQSVMVPDGCWVAPTSNSLDIPQGVSMVGQGFNPQYGYAIEGGTARGQPALYIIGHPTYAIKFGKAGSNSFSGFQVNAWADGQAASQTTCIGTDVNGTAGDPLNYTHFMAYKGCANGYGSPDTSITYFLHSDHTEYGGVWGWGIYGRASDLFSSNDQCDSGGSGCFHFTNAGQIRIEGLRAEYAGGTACIDIVDTSGVQITDSQFDDCTAYGVKISGTSSDITLTGNSFQGSHTAHINLARTTTTPANVNLSNNIFKTDFSTNSYPNYDLSFTTSGTSNDYISINGGSLSSHKKDAFSFSNGSPPHLTVDVQGTAIQGKNANGLFPSHSFGLPSNNWSQYLAFGDETTYYNFVLSANQYYPILINGNLNASETTYSTPFGFDCDIADQNIFPHTNPVNYGNTVYTWLPAKADPTYGAYTYGSFNAHKIDTHGCRMAALTWMATPADYKSSAQAATTTGSWGDATFYSGFLGKTTTQNGDSLSFTTTTYGGPLYLYYALQATATNVASGGTFLYTLDGTTTGTIATAGQSSWTYSNSCAGLCPGSHAPQVLRLPNLSAGAHTLGLSVTSTSSANNPVTILGIGTPPGKPYLATGPAVFYGGQVWQSADANSVFTATYNTDELTDANQLKADGLPVTFVPIRDYLSSGLADTATNGYITSTGQQHIADAFQGAMQFQKNAVSSGPVDPRNYGAVCNAITRSDLSVTISSNIVTSGGYAFTTADIGKSIGIQYALAGTSTITGISGTNAVVSQNAFATGTNTYGSFGNNDTAAIQALSASGKSIQAPNNCLIRNLKIATGQSVIGNSIAQGYGYGGENGYPVWYILGSGSDNDPAFGIDIQDVDATGLRGFMIYGPSFPYNALYSTTTYGYPGFGPGTVCVGGDGHGSGTGNPYWTGKTNSGHGYSIENMDIENCMVGYGRSPGHSGGYLGAQTRSNSFLHNGAATYGPFSDTSFIGDDLTGNFSIGYSLGPQLGAASSANTMRISGSHVEYNGDGIICNNCTGLIASNLSYDANKYCGFRMIGGWGGIQVNGGQYRGSGTHSSDTTAYAFNDSAFCFNSNTFQANAGVDGLTITGAQVDQCGTDGCQKYVFHSDSAFASGQPISVKGGAISNGGSLGIQLWASTPPPKYEIDTTNSPLYRSADTGFSINSNSAVGLQTVSAAPGTILDALSASSTVNSSIGLPNGSTPNRPTTPLYGMYRYNNTIQQPEVYSSGSWSMVGAQPDFIGGLVLSNDTTTPDTVFDISTGSATSDDGTVSMYLSFPWAKSLSSTFTAGYGTGCLDAGSIASNTFYNVFEISSSNNTDVLCSTSATLPTFPSGYTKKRLLKCGVKTDGSSHILPFTQNGDTCLWGTPTLDVNTALSDTSTHLQALNVPTGRKVQPICSFSMGGNTNAALLYSPGTTPASVTTTSPFSGSPGYSYLGTVTTGISNAACPSLITDTSGQIGLQMALTTTTTIGVVTQGWKEILQPNPIGTPRFDGFASFTNNSSFSNTTTTNTLGLTTQAGNDSIHIWSVVGATTTVTALSDTSSLSWTRRKQYNANQWMLEEWYATSPSPLTNDQISITYSTKPGVNQIYMFGMNGTNNSALFDTATALASGATTFGQPSVSLNLTTSIANDVVISMAVQNNANLAFGVYPTITPPANFIPLFPQANIAVPPFGSYLTANIYYLPVSSKLSSYNVRYGTNANASWQGLLVDAVRASGN